MFSSLSTRPCLGEKLKKFSNVFNTLKNGLILDEKPLIVNGKDLYLLLQVCCDKKVMTSLRKHQQV